MEKPYWLSRKSYGKLSALLPRKYFRSEFDVGCGGCGKSSDDPEDNADENSVGFTVCAVGQQGRQNLNNQAERDDDARPSVHVFHDSAENA